MKIRHLGAYLGVILMIALLIAAVAAAVAFPDEPGPALQESGCTPGCSSPTTAAAADCLQIEKLILKSTVRIRIETWAVEDDESGYIINSSVGHATLKDGRYLVTHNHFSVPLPIAPGEDNYAVYGIVTLSDTQGKTCYKGPLSDFELIWSDPQTLVIAHKQDTFFEELGFGSADFKEWSSLPLTPCTEVAQIDWDGETTYVDWVTVKEAAVDAGIPYLILAGDVSRGASGGGVFWHGAHIANNWQLLECYDHSGRLVEATTKVALDPAHVTGEIHQAPTR